MGKIIKNPDGSRTRISSTGRKFHYRKFGEGGNTNYQWSDSNTMNKFYTPTIAIGATKLLSEKQPYRNAGRIKKSC